MQGQAQVLPIADSAALRRTALDCQIRPYGVTDQPLLARFLDVPREPFVPAGSEPLTYSDSELRHPLAAGGARAMLAPLVLARMIQAAEIHPGDRVLDVAGATGYTAALIAGLAAKVVALESDAGLSDAATVNFRALGLTNAQAVCGKLADGVAAEGPYDVILVNGAAETGLDRLLSQLSPAGRLIVLKPQTAGAARGFVYRKDGSSFSQRALFEAAGKLLPEFAGQPAFFF